MCTCLYVSKVRVFSGLIVEKLVVLVCLYRSEESIDVDDMRCRYLIVIQLLTLAFQFAMKKRHEKTV